MRALLLFIGFLTIGFFSQASDFLNPENFIQETSEYKAVVFLSKSCPCSNSHVKHLNELDKQYDNLKIYGVITDAISDESLASVEKYYSKERFHFPIIKDPKQRLVKQYNALKTPHVVLLQKKAGQYTMVYQGGVTDKRSFSRSKKKFLKENLLALQAGKKAPHKEGRCLGCYIRRF